MTLNVTLEDLPFAILEAVRTRIETNRRRLQQGQQQRPRPSLRPRPQFTKLGANSKSWRLPKSAVIPQGNPKTIGVAFWQYVTTGGNAVQYSWRVNSGDYSAVLQGDTGFTKPENAGFPADRGIILPVDGQTGILVLFLYWQSSLRFSAAFSVGLSRIRQIQVPAQLQSIFQSIASGNTQDIVDFASVGYAGSFFDYEFTPTIFERLGVGTKQFPSDKNPIIRDYRYGIYSRYGNFASIPEDQRFYFAEWLGGPDTSDYLNDSLLVSLEDAAILAPAYVDAIFNPDFVSLASLDRVFWDWDDPDYCRQMCLALGFSASDLEP